MTILMYVAAGELLLRGELFEPTFNKRLQLLLKPVNVLLQVVYTINETWHTCQHIIA
jgi:hypothetical protein